MNAFWIWMFFVLYSHFFSYFHVVLFVFALCLVWLSYVEMPVSSAHKNVSRARFLIWCLGTLRLRERVFYSVLFFFVSLFVGVFLSLTLSLSFSTLCRTNFRSGFLLLHFLIGCDAIISTKRTIKYPAITHSIDSHRKGNWCTFFYSMRTHLQ